jgi:hypothetical protein
MSEHGGWDISVNREGDKDLRGEIIVNRSRTLVEVFWGT